MELTDRQLSVRGDVLTLRSLAKLAVTNADAAMTELGLSDGLIDEKHRNEKLTELYEGVVKLATRLDDWDEALSEVRLGCLVDHDDKTLRQACQLLIWQTNHLYAA